MPQNFQALKLHARRTLAAALMLVNCLNGNGACRMCVAYCLTFLWKTGLVWPPKPDCLRS